MFLTQTHTVWGGMEWWVHNLSQRMLDRGWEVYGGLARGARFSDPRVYAAAHPHLRPIVMDARAGTESARIHAVVRALRRVNPDVVIPVGIGAAFEAIRAVDAAFIVPVLSQHEEWLANVIDGQDVIDLTVPNSRLLERVLLAEVGARCVRYIRQGAPRGTTPRSPRTPRLRVAIVSRLEEITKRVLDLARVAGQVGPEIELHVFGDGPDRGALEEKLGSRARFHGYMPTEQLYREAYPNLDVLLFFSPAEGSPNGVYEAMQNGVVPVSSRFAGMACEGILHHGENALLFDVGDTSTAVEHLLALSSDRERLERISIAARTSIASYTDDDMYEAWIDAIESTPRRTQRSDLDASPPSGRLERWGLPAAAADFLRTIGGVRYPHRSGWEEWPGSQPAAPATLARVTKRLAEIERSANDER
ncbi:MAG TPA: glycosyltransferase family 4 protein [Thermoanaerobaculia bacterium]|jgi:glycosyltransferase involved in cell wall biosynthesis|nr:glycosyltransferase family 4 protein [Thermoanaerobaculia bacterium]